MSATLQLSPEQQQFVSHRGADLQVIACAGSGKTESISRRVAALIAEGAPPEFIIAFTFTERAAAELKERIGRRVLERSGRDAVERLGPMFVGTIHGYCFRLLQDHNYLLRYARDAYEDFAGEPVADLDAVDVLTVRQAKDLEWPIVFLPGLVEGRFPSRLSGRPQG